MLLLEPDLREESNQQLVHVVINAHRGLYELALVWRRQALALWKETSIVYFNIYFLWITHELL